MLHLHLRTQQEATEACGHGLAVAPFHVEHVLPGAGTRDPKQGGELAVGFEEQRVRRRALGQRRQILAELTLQVAVCVRPADGEDVAARSTGPGAAP